MIYMSHFFAYLSRMKHIQRWGLMRNTQTENIQEHSLRVAMIAYTLSVARKRVFAKEINPERTAILALYHDASEVITGDLAAPIKYFNPEIKTAYKEIEKVAEQHLYSMLPAEIQQDFERLFFPREEDEEHWRIIKAADKLCAYMKCLEELQAGNLEFARAEKTIRAQVDELKMPEVDWFLDQFIPSFSLTLDELD